MPITSPLRLIIHDTAFPSSALRNTHLYHMSEKTAPAEPVHFQYIHQQLSVTQAVEA